jgi:hypothetical protein
MNKRVALCLYGQPRNYIEGHKYIKQFILEKYEPTVFFHTWFDKDLAGTIYDVSPWRTIDQNYKTMKEDTIDNLVQLYQPERYYYEKPITFNIENIINSNGYQKTEKKTNVNNTLSQMFSRQRVRNILEEYQKENNMTFDMVIGIRFDIQISKLEDFDVTQNIYVFNFHKERPLIFPDNIIISNSTNFLKIFDIFNNILNLLNSEISDEQKISYDHFKIMGGCVINPEELIAAQILFHKLKDYMCKTDEIQIQLI